ncbi:hypothetical protein CKA32_001563 [Geitlerinema sp. FC II]|nr:hypothetical protein CKA32_001563 [Geitlerinema sp. FC II]
MTIEGATSDLPACDYFYLKRLERGFGARSPVSTMKFSRIHRW